jgi:hypothetical protein
MRPNRKNKSNLVVGQGKWLGVDFIMSYMIH